MAKFVAKGIEKSEEFKTSPFITEIEVTNPPSKFIPYPEGTTIKYRPYVFGEIKKHSNSKLSIEDQLYMVLDGITTTKIEPLDLTLADMLFLGVLRRISTVGDGEVKINSRCGKCGKVLESVIKHTDLEVRDLEVPALPVRVKLGERECHFKPLIVRDYLNLLNKNLHQDYIKLMAKTCINIEDEEAEELFFNLSRKDGETLEEVDGVLIHELVPIEIECDNSKCHYKNSIELEGGQNFVLVPFRESTESDSSGICYGLQDEN